jgi:hypothetical protein
MAFWLVGWAGVAAAMAQQQYQAGTSTQPLVFNGTGPGQTTVFHATAHWQVHWDAVPAKVSVTLSTGGVLASSSGSGGTITIGDPGSFKVIIVPDAAAASMPWRLAISQVPALADGVPVTPAGVTVQPGANPLDNAVDTGAPSPEAQAAAIVTISGTRASGFGVLVRTAKGTFVLAGSAIVGANPDLQITTTSNQAVKFGALQGAPDRDLLLISVEDQGYSYLAIPADDTVTAKPGDRITTCGVYNVAGMVQGYAPTTLEISNTGSRGRDGAPILHLRSGTILGLLIEPVPAGPPDVLNRLAIADIDSPVYQKVMHYLGARADNVPAWQPYAWARYESETTFLHNFHLHTLCLANAMAGGPGTAYDMDKPFSDEDVTKAVTDFRAASDSSDEFQKTNAARDFYLELENEADRDTIPIKEWPGYYPHDQQVAQDEIALRAAVKNKLDQMGNDMDAVARLAHPKP